MLPSRILWWASALLLAACARVDVHVPAPPVLDPVPARTSHASILVAGEAEPGAKIRVRRKPELPEAADLPLGEASLAGGRFSVVVPLEAEGDYSVDVIAVARSGYASDPTTFTITRGPPRAEGITLAVADLRPRVTDGGASISAEARVRFGDADDTEPRTVTFHLEAPGASPRDVEVLSDADGIARLDAGGLLVEGSGRLTASVSQGTARFDDTLDFAVRPGPVTSARLELVAPGGSAAVSTTPVGSWLVARLSGLDAGGNRVDFDWALAVSPPSGASVNGGTVRFDAPGSYTITAVIPTEDGTVTATAAIQATGTVPADGAPHFVADVPTSATSGEFLNYTVGLVDAAGHPLTATITVETDDPAVAPGTASGRIVLQRAGLTRVRFAATGTDGPLVSPDFPVAVRPGRPVSLAVTIDGAVAPLPPGASSASVVVAPGAEAVLGLDLRDGAGNAVTPTGLSFALPADVRRIGGTIVAPTRAGTYAIGVSIPGSSVSGVGAFTVPARPVDKVVVSCPAQAIAGVPVRCTASIRDASGNELALAPTWSVTPSTAGTIVDGRAVLNTAGPVTVSATAGTPARQGTATVTVDPAAPTQLTVSILRSPIALGEALDFTVSLVDAFANPVRDLPVVSTNAPSAVVQPGRISGISATGTYSLVVRSPGANLEQATSFTVTAGASSRLALTADRRTLVAGQAAQLTIQLVDANGAIAGTPTDAVVRVDGALPDGLTVRLAGDRLTLFTPGVHVVTATRGTTSASLTLVVEAPRDTRPPAVGLDLPAAPLRPGGTYAVLVSASDDTGLSGLRVRLSGPTSATVLDQTIAVPPGRTDHSGLVSFTLPVNDLGTLTVAATAVDAAGQATSASTTRLVDLHAGNLALSAGTAASISLDPVLRRPVALAAVGDGTLWVQGLGELDGTGSTSHLLRYAAGKVTLFGRLDTFPDVKGLSLVSGTPVLFARNRADADDVVFLRWPAAAPAPQYATVPGIATRLPSGAAGGTARHATSGLTYATESGTGAITGRVLSGAIGATGVVDGTTLPRFETGSYTFTGVCVSPAGAVASRVFLVGTRTAGASVFAGLYRLDSLASTGHVRPTAVLSTHLEEPVTDGTHTLAYGACAVLTGTTERVAFTRSYADDPTTGAQVRLVPADCTGTCPTATTLAAGTAALPLGTLGALAVDGTDLVVAESSRHRLFRLTGF